MSTSLKNPEEHKKRMLSDQPQLMHITSTVLLCHWGQQLLEDMRSLRTDFETHTIWHGYIEEPTAKDFIARNARTIALSKAQGTHWDVIKCKLHLGIAQKLSRTSNNQPYTRVWKSLKDSLTKLYCVTQRGLCHTRKWSLRIFCE